jgi:hypothetical protein
LFYAIGEHVFCSSIHGGMGRSMVFGDVGVICLGYWEKATLILSGLQDFACHVSKIMKLFQEDG